jgi:hypothetical protein
MRKALPRFRDVYGSHPLHLLTLIAGFALLGYVIITIRPAALWNHDTWWQSIAVWFAVAIIGHDLVLFPLYALVDRILVSSSYFRPNHRDAHVPALNYVRVPALACGLTLLVFLPGIIEQGAPTYLAATGQTQQPFLGRWLLLTAAVFATSAAVYGIRLARSQRLANISGPLPGRVDESAVGGAHAPHRVDVVDGVEICQFGDEADLETPGAQRRQGEGTGVGQ